MSNALVRNSELFTSTRLRRLRCGMPAPVSMFQRLATHSTCSTGSCPSTSARSPATARLRCRRLASGRSEPENHIVDDPRRCGRNQAQRLGP